MIKRPFIPANRYGALGTAIPDIEDCSIMVAPYNLCIKLYQEIHTFCRIRTETDNIAKEYDFIHCSCIRKYCFEWRYNRKLCMSKKSVSF